jgi:hypothetical protein
MTASRSIEGTDRHPNCWVGRTARCPRVRGSFSGTAPRRTGRAVPGIRLSGDLCRGCGRWSSGVDVVVAVCADHEGFASFFCQEFGPRWLAGAGACVRRHSRRMRNAIPGERGTSDRSRPKPGCRGDDDAVLFMVTGLQMAVWPLRQKVTAPLTAVPRFRVPVSAVHCVGGGGDLFCRIESGGCGQGVVVSITRPCLRGVQRGDELRESGGALDGVRASRTGRG